MIEMELITTHEDVIIGLNEDRKLIYCSNPPDFAPIDWMCGECDNCKRDKEISKEIAFRTQRIKELIIQFGKEKHEMKKKEFNNRASRFYA